MTRFSAAVGAAVGAWLFGWGHGGGGEHSISAIFSVSAGYLWTYRRKILVLQSIEKKQQKLVALERLMFFREDCELIEKEFLTFDQEEGI